MENVIYIVIGLISLVSIGKVMAKAGQPGWAVLVPIYNVIVLLRVAGKPAWWLLLLLVPLVNIYCLFSMGIEIAKRFGKGTGFGAGLALFPMVFYPVLAFGSAEYSAGE